MVAAGFVRLLTHPSVMITPAAPEHAVDLMAQWFHSHAVSPLNPGTQHIAVLRKMLTAAGGGGNLVTDAPWNYSSRADLKVVARLSSEGFPEHC